MADHLLTIALCQNALAVEERWFIAKDMNCDGVTTISDVKIWLEWVFFSPGDGLLWLLMQERGIATFLELTSANYSGWGAGIVSGIIWLIALGIWGAVMD